MRKIDKEAEFDRLVNQIFENGGYISAREYFLIKNLAICHDMKIKLESSYQVAQIEMTDEAYETAIKILKAIYDMI